MKQEYRVSILAMLLLLLLLSLSGCATVQRVPVAVPCPTIPDVSQEPWMTQPIVTDFSDLYKLLKLKPQPSLNAETNGSSSSK